jgi:hypothetical protein
MLGWSGLPYIVDFFVSRRDAEAQRKERKELFISFAWIWLFISV